MRSHPLLLLAILLLGMPALSAEPRPASARLSAAVQQWVEQNAAGDRVAEALPRFYAAREHQPAWFLEGVALAQAGDYLAALGEAEREGLRPERYERTALARDLHQLTLPGAPEDAWLELELRLTVSFLTYASHLHHGQVPPERFRWRTEKPEVDLAAALEQALATGDMGEALQELAPRHDGYLYLRDALARYRAIAAEGGWPLLPEGELLRRGMSHPRVAVLRQRLRITGELKEPEPRVVEQLTTRVFAQSVGTVALEEGLERTAGLESSASLPVLEDEQLFDAELEEAVRAFQRRHGLEVDGLVGKRTLAALRVPVEARIDQLLVNLERWRWLPEELGARHVLVNLPAFELVAVEEREPVLRMRVIIGREGWNTPIFTEQVEYLVLNPAWYVPRRIAALEVVPRLEKDPQAAARVGMIVTRRSTGEVVSAEEVDWSEEASDYRFHQEAGPLNPLGSMKFIFPNRFSVYLHGTPDPAPFEAPRRALSHGCIRVEDPLALADFLLAEDDGWDEARLAEAVESGVTQRVELAESIPVHLLYWTSFMDAEGQVHFRQDIYRRDTPLRRALGLERDARG